MGLPEDFEVYAVGRYSGIKQTSLKLGKSGNITKEVDVIVNKPHAPIVLVLSAYDPVVWKVRYTSESLILAVIVSGYHTQALLGIPKTVPAIFATYEEKDDCGAFYAYQADPSLLDANSEIRRITGKEIKHLVIRPQADVFYVGPSEGIDKNGLLYSTDRTIGDYGGR